MKQIIIWSIGLIALGLMSCQIDRYDNTSQNVLKTSVDTLTFDTVFQTIGSATRSFKIYNPTSNIITISYLYLESRGSSLFRMNANGSPGYDIRNIEILAHDSIWVFVDVTIPANNSSLFVNDRIVISYNGGKQYVNLLAFGQDIYLHNGEIISSSTTWNSNKPHVIIQKNTPTGLIPGVIVPSSSTLTIQPGCKLYFSNSAGILVQGNLQCNGSKDQPIKMRGMRLESTFQHIAGQWLGILIERNSRNNLINYTTIDESTFGIWVGFQSKQDFNNMSDATRASITITHSIVSNAYYWALKSLNNIILAENSLFFTSTDYLIQLFLGGKYTFDNCTFYNNQSKDNKGLFILSNQYYDNSSATTYKNPLTSSIIRNSILYTTASESLLFNIDATINAPSDYLFTNCDYNSSTNFTNPSITQSLLNQDPKFISTEIDKENFQLQNGSPCINTGTPNLLSNDLIGNPRPIGIVDIGAYEKQ